MPSRLFPLLCAAFLASSLLPSPVQGQLRTPEQVLAALEAADNSRQPYPRNLLGSLLGFDRSHMQDLDRGEVVLGEAIFDDGDEVAVVGAVRVRGDRETFLRTMHPNWRYRRSNDNAQMGLFSDNPSVRDMAGLTLSDKTFDEIRDCEPGDCDVQLSLTGMHMIRDGVDFDAPDARERVLANLKAFAVDYIRDYKARGMAAFEDYRDSDDVIDPEEEFRKVMGHAMIQEEQEPRLHHYLADYPERRPEGVEDTFLWIRNRGNPIVDPTLVLVHAATYTDPDNPGRVSMVDKLLYASHYAVASMGETAVVADPDVEDGFYVIRMQRIRFHVGGGLAHGLVMNRVRAALRHAIELELEMAQRVAARR